MIENGLRRIQSEIKWVLSWIVNWAKLSIIYI